MTARCECGAHVSRRYARVFSPSPDEETVRACPDCTSATERRRVREGDAVGGASV